MGDGVEILLNTIVNNQERHEKKLDDLKDDVHRVEDSVKDTEHRIMGQVSQQFVKKEEFPQMLKAQRKKERLENMKDFATGTGLVMNVKSLVVWAVALVVAFGFGGGLMGLIK